jgi:hypothetical protein
MFAGEFYVETNEKTWMRYRSAMAATMSSLGGEGGQSFSTDRERSRSMVQKTPAVYRLQHAPVTCCRQAWLPPSPFQLVSTAPSSKD